MKTAFITGGSRGIGFALANLFIQRGWNVISPMRRELDLSSNVSVQDYLYLHPRPALDALIFCHGEWYTEPFSRQDDLHYIGQYRQRVLHPIKMIRAWCHKELSTVMVASTRGLIGGVVTQPYSLACAAQIVCMLGMAKEGLGKYNVVAPGLTDTDMGKEVRVTKGCKSDAVAQDPLAVAENIVMLVESGATGRVVRVVDGVASEAKWTW